MKNPGLLLYVGLLVLAAAAPGAQDRGGLSLSPRTDVRTKVFNDGRSVVAYHQEGTMTGGRADGPWANATLYAQGTVFKDAAGAVVAEAALWETIDPDGDLVWGVVWRPAGVPPVLDIKAGTGKWAGIAGRGAVLEGESRWTADWSIADRPSAALRGRPADYVFHDSGFSFHGPHVTDRVRTLPNGVTLTYNNQSGVLLSDDRDARSPRNFAASFDRGTTYSIAGKDLADVMLLEDTDPDGDMVWLYHEWWYGKGPGSYEFIGGTGKWAGITGYGVTNGVLRDRVDDHWLIKSEMHWNIEGPGGATVAALSTPHTLELGWRVSCQHYSIRDRGLFEAMEALAGLGIRNIEPADFLKLESGGDTVTDFRMPAAELARLKMRLAGLGMSTPSWYVSNKADMTDRRMWAFMKEMGVEIVCGEPEPASLPAVDALCEEFGLKLAIHNHPEGHSVYWRPDEAIGLIAAQDPLGPAIGLCPDVGHWARACVDVLQGLETYRRARPLYVLHVKDVPEACQGWQSDLPLGRGVVPVRGVFDALSWRGWRGIVTIELEADPPSLPDIGACARYIEDYAGARSASGALAGLGDRGWADLVESRRADLERAIERTFDIIVGTDEDRLMGSVLLWDDGRIEIHYRDYKPDDTSLARAAIRVYHAVSRARADHAKEPTEAYVRRMKRERPPDPRAIVEETLRALRREKK